MKKRIFIICLLIAVIYLPMATFDTAEAQCRTKANCKSADDTGYYLLDYDGPYTPCANSISWTVSFERTLQTEIPNTIRTNITGDLFLQNYYSEDYEPGSSQNFSGTQYVGTGTQTLNLKRIGSNTGNFTDIKVNVSYFSGQPD